MIMIAGGSHSFIPQRVNWWSRSYLQRRPQLPQSGLRMCTTFLSQAFCVGLESGCNFKTLQKNIFKRIMIYSFISWSTLRNIGNEPMSQSV